MLEYYIYFCSKQKQVAQVNYNQKIVKNFYWKVHVLLKKINSSFFILNDHCITSQLWDNYDPATEVLKYLTFSDKYVLTNWETTKLFSTLMYSFTKFSTAWYFINISVLRKHKHFYIVWYRFYNKTELGDFYKCKEVFLNLFIKLLYFKDITDFLVLFKQLLLTTHLKKHKRIFFNIRLFLQFWFEWAFKYNLARGYSFFFKGKLAKKGSVRKTKIFFKEGRVSFTNKELKVNYETYTIWTYTGVMGAGVSIFF